jgi:hypothetical protein
MDLRSSEDTAASNLRQWEIYAHAREIRYGTIQDAWGSRKAILTAKSITVIRSGDIFSMVNAQRVDLQNEETLSRLNTTLSHVLPLTGLPNFASLV